MKFNNRQTQFPGRKKVKKLNSENQQVEEYFVVMENAEGMVTSPGTPVNSENLEKANWRDDTNISFRTIEEGENEPTPTPNITQIYTKRNGETWIVPSAESGAQAKVITDPAGTVIMVDNKRPPTVEFDEDPQYQIDKNRDAVTELTRDQVTHRKNYANPHTVTKEQIGLGNADNTSDADKPVSAAQQAALNDKANLINGKMSDPIYFEEFNGTLLQFMDSVPIGSTKESILSNALAEKPFSEWPDEYGVLTKVSRYNDDIFFIECRLGADIVLHASRFIIRDHPDNGWIRPKRWKTTYDAVDIRDNGGILFNQEYSSEKYCKGILSDGTALRVTINDPRVNRTETIILNFMTGGEAGSIFLPEAQSVGNMIFIGWTIFERRDKGRAFCPFLYSSNVLNGGNWYADAYARIVKIERETYI